MRKSEMFGVLLASCLLVACGANPMAEIYENDTKIASEGNSFNYYKDIEQNIEDSSFTASVHGMDGMDTVWTYNTETESEIQVNFDMALNVGNVKVVFISPDGQLDTIAECTEEETLEGTKTVAVKKGENRIKIVSREKAEFDISLNIDEGTFEKLSF
ncbi:hypothetical protein SAMN06296386_103343 [Lachnospiraceae bacterium]|nr:hypothetical protein SAMN06296386_103343 [Lachnospiraceae bacterium]